MRFNKVFRSCSYRLLLISLCIGLANGLIYVFLVPPWQHNDEPNHFEYAWLIGKRGSLPAPEEYDVLMRRAVARSMIRHGFYRDLDVLPDMKTDPVWIGAYSQLSNSPFYYILASIPIRLLPTENVTLQLYSSRLVSLFLYLISLTAAWGIVSELTPRGHPLQLLVPLTLALLPAYTDLMTSINNDVGAVALFSLSLWGGVRIIRRGLSLVPVVLTTILVLLCYMTKETAYIALPIFLIALLFAVYHGSNRRVAWVLFLVGLTAIPLAVLSWGDAAYWYRSTAQDEPDRVVSEKAVLGKYVFQLETGAEVTPAWLVPLFHPVPGPYVAGLQGKTYTLGAWIWANKPVEISTPLVWNGGQVYYSNVTVGEEPKFFSVPVKMAENASSRVWVSLDPIRTSPEENIVVYYDGLVLAEGEYSLDEVPRFTGPDGREGTWSNSPFTNLLRNASAERGWVRFRPWADQLGSKIAPDHTRPSLILTYLFDWQGANPFYRSSANRLFQTFWGFFGWGHVPLVGYHPYQILLLATVAGVGGAGIALYRKRKMIPWEGFLLLGIAFLIIWGTTFVRGAIYLSVSKPYFPVARYTFTAIIPTMLLMSLGWWELLNHIGCWLRLPDQGKMYLYTLLLLGFNALAIISIYKFYSA